MQTPVRGAWRLVRAAAVASTVVGLAASAHLVAGGTLPGPVLLLALTALVLCASLLLAARRLSAPVLLAVLGAGQLGLHQAFCWFGVALAPVHPAGHHLDPAAAGTAQALHGVAAAGGAAVPMTGLPMSSPAMTAAHVLATVVAALVLARGEALLWRLWTWWRPLRAVVLTVLRLPVLPRVPRFPALTVPRPSFVVARRVPRRGPPRVPALASTTG